jgi:uncharacterized membrane protein
LVTKGLTLIIFGLCLFRKFKNSARKLKYFDLAVVIAATLGEKATLLCANGYLKKKLFFLIFVCLFVANQIIVSGDFPD